MRTLQNFLIFIITTSALSSCGLIFEGDVKEGKKRQFSTTDSTFLPLVQKFETEANEQYGESNFKVGDVPINFGDTTDDRFDGVCIKYPDSTKEIIVKKSWWDQSSEIQKEILIFHELGHCRLNRTHNDSTSMAYDNNVSVKISVMNSVVPNGYYYNEYRAAYLTELYNSDVSQLALALEGTNTTTPTPEGSETTPTTESVHGSHIHGAMGISK